MARGTRWAVAAALLSAAPALAQTMQVEVPEAPLKERPQRFAPTVASVKLGESVNVLEKQDPWWKVQPAGKPAGWIASTALTKHTTKLTAGGGGGTGVSQDEEGLAMRPFDRDVEKRYRSDNPGTAAGFAALERIEADPTYRVSDAQIVAFLQQGGLSAGKGGAQ